MAQKATTKSPTITARRATFLQHLAKNANVSKSAKLAGVSTSALYEHRAKTAAFASQWDAAIAEALDELEQLVIERAKRGVAKPVFYAGKKVGTVRNYSDTLAMFMLKAKRPEVYARLHAEVAVESNDDAARAEVLRRLARLDGND
ncbi:MULTISPECIES: hypothetical protein [unclassified Sphingomonas]|uniref:hypothetical protein n=1 Tax=unclassified Sphingomonas TaxID=196159 RepID=UPI0026C0D94F